MNLTLARKFLKEALDNGLQLHGISASGRPAISFDPNNPGAVEARRVFLSTQGLVRELLRAAMIEHCRQQELPLEIPSAAARAQLLIESNREHVLH